MQMGGRGRKEKEQKQVLLPLSSGNRKGKHCTVLSLPQGRPPLIRRFIQKREKVQRRHLYSKI